MIYANFKGQKAVLFCFCAFQAMNFTFWLVAFEANLLDLVPLLFIKFFAKYLFVTHLSNFNFILIFIISTGTFTSMPNS